MELLTAELKQEEHCTVRNLALQHKIDTDWRYSICPCPGEHYFSKNYKLIARLISAPVLIAKYRALAGRLVVSISR